MHIAGREIGRNLPPYIVAEISANHNGSLTSALELIELAKHAGADAVKFQCYTPDTISMDGEFVIHDGPWKGRKLYDLYKERHTPYSWFPKLFDHAEKRGITCFASVFDETAVDMLEQLGCPAYKIASFEITDIPLIQYAAATGKQIIISTGMATYDEILDADAAVNKRAALLHCVSGYPTPISEANLGRMTQLGLDGISDHTKGIEIPIAAIALGAGIIEKHLYRSRHDCEADFSISPLAFGKMVHACRSIWRAMNQCEPKSEGPQRQLRRSIHAIASISRGEKLTKTNVATRRPSGGLPPKLLPSILGKEAGRDITRGEPILQGMFYGD